MLDREITETDEDTSASVDQKPTPEQLAALRHLVTSGFIPTIEEMAKRLTAPFFWYAPERPGGSRTMGGGTVCFVDTGVRLLGLTAAHVHKECVTALERDPELGCQIGGHSFQPSKHLIDIDEDLDLATYELSEIQVNAAGADIHAPSTWPPSLTDDLVLVGGWPWSSVVEHIGSSTHDFLLFIGCSAGASEHSLSMATDRGVAGVGLCGGPRGDAHGVFRFTDAASAVGDGRSGLSAAVPDLTRGTLGLGVCDERHDHQQYPPPGTREPRNPLASSPGSAANRVRSYHGGRHGVRAGGACGQGAQPF